MNTSPASTRRTWTPSRATPSWLAYAAVMVVLACSGESTPSATTPSASASAGPTVGPTNRIHLPAGTRDNLGVTFARAERRMVTRTLRIAGHIALTPEATRRIRAPMSGPVTVLVPLHGAVTPGMEVARLRPPEVRVAQDALHRARHDGDEAADLARVAEARRLEAERAVASIQRRVRALGDVNMRRADVELELEAAKRRSDVAVAELQAARARIERERHHFSVQLQAFSERMGVSVADLLAAAPDATTVTGEVPERWEIVGAVTLRAGATGVVTRLHVVGDGWAAEGDPLLDVVDPQQWRFEGQLLEADLARLPDAAKVGPVSADVTPAWPPDLVAPAAVAMTLRLGVAGDPQLRRFPVFASPTSVRPPWALPGVGAFAEVVLSGTGEPENAIPKAAIVRDGLISKVFVRDPMDADQVIETEVDLGPDDGRWVAVLAGVNAGAEVVLAGAYELQVSRASQPVVKGHFHADGSFHAAADDDSGGGEH